MRTLRIPGNRLAEFSDDLAGASVWVLSHDHGVTPRGIGGKIVRVENVADRAVIHLTRVVSVRRPGLPTEWKTVADQVSVHEKADADVDVSEEVAEHILAALEQ